MCRDPGKEKRRRDYDERRRKIIDLPKFAGEKVGSIKLANIFTFVYAHVFGIRGTAVENMVENEGSVEN